MRRHPVLLVEVERAKKDSQIFSGREGVSLRRGRRAEKMINFPQHRTAYFQLVRVYCLVCPETRGLQELAENGVAEVQH